MKRLFLAVLAVLAILLTSVSIAQDGRGALPFPPTPETLTNEWAVYLTPDADPDAAAAQLGMINLGQVGNLTGIYHFIPRESFRTARPDITAALESNPQVIQAVQQVSLIRETRGVENTITDPLFLSQWHLNNLGAGAGGSGTAGADANVFPAWNAGYTGTGIVVASVDDGVWHTNPDIAPNYRADLSWDYVNNDADPSGGGHGTSVAGMMAADNDGATCGVGIAFNAQVAGVRLLGGGVTDTREAAAVSHQNSTIHVYNNSWGPSDNGSVLEAPGPLTLASLENNLTVGRGGLGAITVWAAGNGKAAGDNVNADGYANLRGVIAVSATTNTGVSSWYSEPGSPIMINAPSNGGSAGIVTTGYGSSGCNTAFGGTSSAAPLVGGVVALILEANPALTWRDVQYILIETAEKNDPTNPDWTTNAAGYAINHYYGFGRVDAGAAVALAATWVNVPPELSATSAVQTVNQTIPDNNAWVSRTITVTDPMQVEHAEVVLNITHASRGQLEIELISPQGTTSRLMFGRTSDGNPNFVNWRMTSVRHWGEEAAGTWTLRVRDTTSGISGMLNNWQLKLYGVQVAPRITESNIPSEILFGDTATLGVTVASSIPVTYQWYQGVTGDTANPIGTDSPIVTTGILNVDTAFWVAITDGFHPIQSPTYTVTVVDSFSLIGTTGWDNGSLLPFRTLTPSNDKLVCSKLSNTPPCAFRFVGSATEKGKLAYDIVMATRNFTLKTTNEWRISGLYNAKGVSAVKINVKYDFTDPLAWDEQYQMTLSGGSGWQPFEMIIPISHADVTSVKIRIRNQTKTGAKVWLDDLDVRYALGSNAPRAAAFIPSSRASILDLPEAPDGFRAGD